MENKDRVRLRHIIDSCNAIQKYMEGRKRADLSSNRMLMAAVIRELEIIGEAVTVLSSDFKLRHNHMPWKDMSGMRNRLIHAYFNVNPDVVWKTISIDVPILLKAVHEILENTSDN
jgi:uncharacterized protein with HEPN domain